MLDEVKTFKLSRILPWIGLDIDETLNRADMSFDSIFWLKSVEIPILIMHAEDDKMTNAWNWVQRCAPLADQLVVESTTMVNKIVLA